MKVNTDAQQVGELLCFEQTKLPSGLFRYAAAGDGHDDMVLALALSQYAVEQQGALRATGQQVGVWKQAAEFGLTVALTEMICISPATQSRLSGSQKGPRRDRTAGFGAVPPPFECSPDRTRNGRCVIWIERATPEDHLCLGKELVSTHG